NLAEKLALRYQQIYPRSTFKGIFGVSDIHNPKKEEEEKIFSIVADYKPQILFVAFGSPYQELWLYHHADRLQGIICMGVGGSFDFLTGRVKRAPMLIRRLGLEWFFRLIVEPWRWKRQLRLVEFVYLIGKQRLGLLK
ncbi:MAG TPA: WecB/TagA/CpsF family glycosyltransferase, partial [Candidatus Woesebacteria bacterium]|nr:WecB/TagA/CpsF family glycosyltransferase [Candidatus Woesebacteria bacterium]